MTFLQLVNQVLKRLREDEVNAIPDDGYPALVAGFVNDAKEEIEDKGPWYSLRSTVNRTMTVGEDNVDFTAETNDRSYLMFTNNIPQIYISTAGEERHLQLVQPNEMANLWLFNPDTPNATPDYVSYTKDETGLMFRVFPAPDAALTLRARLVIPQDALEDDADELSIPSGPVWRLALLMAMEERGEEFAGPLARAEQRYNSALNDAMSADFLRDPLTAEGV